MRKILLALALTGLLYPQAGMSKKKSKKNAAAALPTPKVDDWSKAVKGAKTYKGMFTAYLNKEGKLYFELADSVYNRDYILSNRIARTSNTHDYVAGQMVSSPLLVRFATDSVKVYMYKVQHAAVVSPTDPIAASFKSNFSDPVLKAFKVVARKKDRVLIDMTSLFGGNDKLLTPIKTENPLEAMFGGRKALKGSFNAEASGIIEVKAFPYNMEIKTNLSYDLTTGNQPYTVQMHRSLFVAPKTLMRARIHDNRVGYFMSDKKLYSSDADRVEEQSVIHRWRLEPKDGEWEKYYAGQLVEPKKPIIFYVDSAFPPKWRETVKQGVTDWNKAFEAAGFKNAVIAKDYPKNDPDFDPDDMRYSCIKYAVTETANAMGPSYVDPRTGEILTADVIWYHNVVSLLHDWRFAQTGAVDYRTHKKVFDDDLMRESMRYVTSHEVGHTLGLMHNMGASYSFPVDSLRSPSFTRKYGTTPSIMDYARNNFVAQPGDLERGVKMTPPVLGVEDINAIKWGYRLIKDARTSRDEVPTLNRWIAEKADDPMYTFGAQQVFGTVDVSAQTEDLGNDHVKAGDYAVSNLKIIMRNLEQWTAERGENYDNMKNTYKSIVNQYGRHLGHVLPYLGGVIYHEVRQGDGKPAKTYLSRQAQRRAMRWIVDQGRTYRGWLCPQKLLLKFDRPDEIKTDFTRPIVTAIYGGTTLQRVDEGHKLNAARNYSLDQYMTDAFSELFGATRRGASLSEAEMEMQRTAIDFFVKSSGIKTDGAVKKSSAIADNATLDLQQQLNAPELPCENMDARTSFVRINYGLPTLKEELYKPLMLRQLKRVQALYRQKRATGNRATRDFYDYQLTTIDKLFK
ncbi:zinc-dependent metalloprotease [Prevotella sp. A2931]|uniref:Zinc-dependent metalloprotease n=1 Tax=Prevotella illustrans TaxID=2800387 RepID=A0ABS3M6K1_9BACT|nr:zinc-dependent metalloprotease [Prevotella illustrans]PTL27362.1 hypothetical protein C3V39_06850 [Prevotella sp. oral taxon 820]